MLDKVKTTNEVIMLLNKLEETSATEEAKKVT